MDFDGEAHFLLFQSATYNNNSGDRKIDNQREERERTRRYSVDSD